MMKKRILGISGVISLLLFLLLNAVSFQMAASLQEQQMAQRWSAEGDTAQISCFFSTNAEVTEDTIAVFEHSIDSALLEASITVTSENPGARLWADAYSADGKVSISSDHGSMEADAIGIGGDFFLFHPLKLLSGSYFSGNDLMQDYCVIDEDAAWQLFGSNNVAGMTVTIGGIPHMVTGVVERPQGRLEKAAGLDATVVYVSYKTLSELGRNNGINHYEIVMPNPVSDFAYNHVKDNIGISEKEVEIVENTSRYSLLSKLKSIGAFGTRSMNGKAIIYPYWENIARGYEDILATMTFFLLILLAYPVILAVIFFILWWRHKGWTLREVWLKIKDKQERYVERLRESRKAGKESKNSGKESSQRGIHKKETKGKMKRDKMEQTIQKGTKDVNEDNFEEEML